MGIELVVLIAVGFALLRTRIGKAARAVADNPALAASSGINVDRVIRIVWTAGGAIAALAGIMLGMSAEPELPDGLQDSCCSCSPASRSAGSAPRSAPWSARSIVGLFIQVSTLWVPPELKTVGALAVLIVVLLFRPQGILGRRERIG